MKTKFCHCLILLALSTLSYQLSTCAQGTAFTYQGRLNDGANPASGIYDLRFAIYDAAGVGTQQGSLLTNAATAVSNGLFTVTLDFSNQFPGASRWLEIAVRTNGASSFITLAPRQRLTPAPYAITASSVVSGGIAGGTYGNAVTFNNANNNFAGDFGGNGGGLTNVNAAMLGGLGANQFWKTGGNSSTVAGANFLATTDNQPLEVHVNNARVLRIEPEGTNAPNVVWGHPANSVSPGVVGAVIGGGGGFAVTTGAPLNNMVTDAHTVVGGGLGNIAGDNDADLANARYATVGGGLQNQAAGRAATIAGGDNNLIAPGAFDSTIAGGQANLVISNSVLATIGGGQANVAGGGPYVYYSTVAGGAGNFSTNSAATVGGGQNNIAGGSWSTIAGGYRNQSLGQLTTVGGGSSNTSSNDDSTVAGGLNNAAGAYAALVSGGQGNTSSGSEATVGGGNGNVAASFAATVGGGNDNYSGAQYATVSGGDHNTNNGYASFIGGGSFNLANGFFATVPGGAGNYAVADYSFAAGTDARANHSGSFVWSDASDISGFASTTANEFNVRAVGGARFVTGGAGITLDGQPVVTSSALNNLNAANVTSGTLADAQLSANVALRNASLNTFAGDLALSGGAAYHNLSLSGGNSTGFLYGSYAKWGDGVHLGYNYYADANGTGHIPAAGGGTSRISADYGEIVLAVGAVNTAPSAVRLDATLAGVTVYGTFNNLSDRNAKQDFAPVSSSAILDAVLQLPVSEWSYKEDPTTRHIGPVAQDFHSAFNIGTDDKHIAPIDEGGVALAAIQGLNQKLEQKEVEITELKQRLEVLEGIIRNQKSN